MAGNTIEINTASRFKRLKYLTIVTMKVDSWDFWPPENPAELSWKKVSLIRKTKLNAAGPVRLHIEEIGLRVTLQCIALHCCIRKYQKFRHRYRSSNVFQPSCAATRQQREPSTPKEKRLYTFPIFSLSCWPISPQIVWTQVIVEIPTVEMIAFSRK